jgi:co-chaperonin GroES (HSP10)
MVLRDEVKEKKSDSGNLIIPDRAVEMANQGEVRAVSADSSYEVGQRVVFVKYSGADLELNGVTYTLLKEMEVKGTVIEVNVPETVKEKEDALQKALAQFEATGRG